MDALSTAILGALVRAPLCAPRDLALALGRPVTTIYSGLACLTRGDDPPVAAVTVPRPRGRPVRLSYLTRAGLRLAAGDGDPDALAAHFGLAEDALRQRLARVDHLLVSRRLLLTLAGALVDADGGALSWRAWPTPWRDPAVDGGLARRVRRVEMDGELHALFPGGDERRVALLYDGDERIPAAALHDRLAAIAALPLDAGLPTVLLVTCDPSRVPDALPPRLLWCAVRDAGRSGILAASCWRGVRTGGRPVALAAGLGALGAYGRWGRAAAAHEGRRAATGRDGRARSPMIVRPDLTLAPLAARLLAVVAAQPLATLAQAARLADVSPNGALYRAMAACRDGGLLAVVRDGRCGRDHYTATRPALAYLATQQGMTPRQYRRLHGAVADAGPDDRALRNMKGHLGHTHAVIDTFLALRAAARRGAAALAWQGEWTAWRPYGGRRGRLYLRPDAWGEVRRRGAALAFFLEYDSGREDYGALAAKLARYYAYRDDRGLATLTVLVVTPRRRVERWLAVDARVAARLRGREALRLDLRVTTPAALAGGALGPIWRTRASALTVPLLGGP